MSKPKTIPQPDNRSWEGPEARRLVCSAKLRPAEMAELERVAAASGVSVAAAIRYALTQLPGWSLKGGE